MMSKEATSLKKEVKRPLPIKRKGRPCHFCENKLSNVDYKDVDLLRRFISARGKILPRRQSNCCAKHQRKVSEAIKLARFMCLLPFVADN